MSLVDQINYQETSKGQKKLLDVAGAGLLPEILPSSRASQRENICPLTLARLIFLTYIQVRVTAICGEGYPQTGRFGNSRTALPMTAKMKM
jgi:hypothetical protein